MRTYYTGILEPSEKKLMVWNDELGVQKVPDQLEPSTRIANAFILSCFPSLKAELIISPGGICVLSFHLVCTFNHVFNDIVTKGLIFPSIQCNGYLCPCVAKRASTGAGHSTPITFCLEVWLLLRIA